MEEAQKGIAQQRASSSWIDYYYYYYLFKEEREKNEINDGWSLGWRIEVS
jgi:hypothetical protein